MNFKPIPFLKNNNITITIQNYDRWYGWLTAGEKSCKNYSITYFNSRVDNSILDDEVNACEIIAITRIEITFDNDYIHLLHDIPKWYI